VKVRLAPRVAERFAPQAARVVAATWRFEYVARDRWDALRGTGRGFACMLWHEALLPLLWAHRGIGAVIVVSHARDGQYLADFAESIGYRLVRGSSSRGAVGALLAATRELQGGAIVALTPDGPRGPRRDLKTGVLVAAQRAGVPLLPVHAEANRAWRLNSWDRFGIPKPFARVRVAYGEPIMVGRGAEALSSAVTAAHAGMENVERMALWPDGTATRTD